MDTLENKQNYQKMELTSNSVTNKKSHKRKHDIWKNKRLLQSNYTQFHKVYLKVYCWRERCIKSKLISSKNMHAIVGHEQSINDWQASADESGTYSFLDDIG